VEFKSLKYGRCGRTAAPFPVEDQPTRQLASEAAACECEFVQWIVYELEAGSDNAARPSELQILDIFASCCCEGGPISARAAMQLTSISYKRGFDAPLVEGVVLRQAAVALHLKLERRTLGLERVERFAGHSKFSRVPRPSASNYDPSIRLEDPSNTASDRGGRGGGLAGIVFVLRRWWRRERLDEIIARRLKLVSLYQRMTAAKKLDMKALEELERDLSGDRR
jgi:hypothetical protein